MYLQANNPPAKAAKQADTRKGKRQNPAIIFFDIVNMLS